MPRWTSLAKDDVWVHHTEHVLAALAFCEVDNVVVELDSEALPMVANGTCVPFVQAIRQAGLQRLDEPCTLYRLKAPILFLDHENTEGQSMAQPSVHSGRYLAGLPAEEFLVSAVFHWSHQKALPIGFAEYDRGRMAVDETIVSARSYLVESERESVRDLLSTIQDDVMHLFPGCPPELGMEAARHKIVDFVGDMMILGKRLNGFFLASRTGHRIHHAFLRHLLHEDLLEEVRPEGRA